MDTREQHFFFHLMIYGPTDQHVDCDSVSIFSLI